MRARIGIWKRGDPAVLLSATGLAITLLLLTGMVVLVAWQGLGTFWPEPLEYIETSSGRKALVEVERTEPGPRGDRMQVKLANRDVEGLDFAWIDVKDVVRREVPAEAAVVERLTWGDFHGWLVEVKTPDGAAAKDDDERGEAMERTVAAQKEKATNLGPETVWRTGAGHQVTLRAGAIMDAWRPNRMGAGSKVGHYLGGAWEFVSGDPRESNTEGGIWPAIFG